MERNQRESPSPETIRDEAIARFTVVAKVKFDKGQAAHGGCILDRDLVGEIENEAIDLWMYVSALRRKMDEIKRRESTEEAQGQGGQL